jgi:hypothetical protein
MQDNNAGHGSIMGAQTDEAEQQLTKQQLFVPGLAHSANLGSMAQQSITLKAQATPRQQMQHMMDAQAGPPTSAVVFLFAQQGQQGKGSAGKAECC